MSNAPNIRLETETPTQSSGETALRPVFAVRAVQLLLVGVYCVLGWVFERACPGRAVYALPDAAQPLTRHQQRMEGRELRLAAPRTCHTQALRPLLPQGLSRTQYLERLTRIAMIGRFQIYDWLYYRWEFWRRGAVKLRGRLQQNARGTFAALRPFGLSAAHLGPD